MRCYVLMGVSGCGKSSVGLALSVTCGMTFSDGDDLHPQANIKKMSCGKPLSDKDRSPWLSDVGRTLAKGSRPIVIGCSALKKNYRDIIRSKVQEPVHFLHLDAPQDVLVRRIVGRVDHFMPTALLDSQFGILERLEGDEWGCQIDITQAYPNVITQAETYVKETMI